MDYWQGVLARINIPGAILVLVGAGVSFGAKKLAPLVFKEPDNKVLPMKFAGLALVCAGALITLF
ncbi:MAG TPA: hypothetical protein PKU80_10480 [Candidatus Limiplasma sp.]|nr:hypothetical protein [Candidatus Limiplasma sp.]HRX09739.1 hypothetical protein [Candidatus Limiplasma sp.]